MKPGWQTKRLGDVCEIIKGRKPVLKQTPSKGDLPYLVAKVMRGTEEAEYASVNDRNSVIVSESEIIIICDGSNSGEVFTGFNGILSSTMGKISKKAEIDDDYLRAFLGSIFEVFNSAKTGAAIPHLDKEALYALLFPYPSLPEQRRIVGILDETFDGIAIAKANAKKNLQNARALFESYLQAVFTQRCEGWMEKRLEEVCVFKGGGTPSKAIGRYWCGDIPWVSPKDMKSEVVSDSIDHITMEAIESSATSLIPKNTILMVVRSGILARTVPIAMTGRELTINQDLKALCPKSIIDPRFLYCLLEAKMPMLLSIVSRGATVHRLITDQIRSMPFLLPPKNEQHRIVTQIDSLRKETQRLESIYQQKHAALDALKKSLLNQAFTGQL